MAVTIGLPRGLLFHYYGTIWFRFFENLGANVIISSNTTKMTLQQGDVLDEVCVPLKAYFGHVAEICTKVDYLFVPRVVSVAQHDYNCPKIIGLPDLLRSRMTNLPGMIDVNVSMRQDRNSVIKAVVQAGEFAGANAMRSLYAWYAANQSKHVCYPTGAANNSLRIALIGHPYIINDRQVSMDALNKLTGMGVTAITADCVPLRMADQAARALGKKLYWTYGRHLVGASLTFLEGPNPVDGLIFMTSFSCGLDSLIGELINQQAKKKDIPFMMLSIDEHTAEAGMITRLEAFTDMLKRRRGLK